MEGRVGLLTVTGLVLSATPLHPLMPGLLLAHEGRTRSDRPWLDYGSSGTLPLLVLHHSCLGCALQARRDTRNGKSDHRSICKCGHQAGNAAAWAEPSKCSVRRCSMEASCGFVQLSNPRCSSPVKAHLILPGQCLMPVVSKSLLRILHIVR